MEDEKLIESLFKQKLKEVEINLASNVASLIDLLIDKNIFTEDEFDICEEKMRNLLTENIKNEIVKQVENMSKAEKLLYSSLIK